MSDLNAVIFTGRLGADPESRNLPSGEPVCNFRVACSEQWKDKTSGEKKEVVEWIGCSAFGKLAEICQQYLRKGSQVACHGKMRTRKWQDKSGNDRWTTEVILAQMTMMGSKPANGEQAAAKPPADTPAEKKNEDLDDVPF